MKAVLGIIFITFLSCSVYSQGTRRAVTRRRAIKKEEFIHTWKLTQIRNGANDLVTNRVAKKTLRFTADSIYIQTSDMLYIGTWQLEKGQIQIHIPDCPQCNYKWTVMGEKTICFRIGEDISHLECFKRQD